MASRTPYRKRIPSLVFQKTNGVCYYCGTGLLKNKFYIDHFIAFSKGGGVDLENLVPACRSCNSSKGARDLERFRFTLFSKKLGAPAFTEEQIEWLKSAGFDLKDYILGDDGLFWFEKN